MVVDIGGKLPHIRCAFLAAERKALPKDLHLDRLLRCHQAILLLRSSWTDGEKGTQLVFLTRGGCCRIGWPYASTSPGGT